MKKRNVVLLVILLVVGFASLSTSFIILGTFRIGPDKDDFIVIFKSAEINGDDGVATIDKDTKRSLVFTSSKLTNVEDKAVLNYVVKNNSTQYDADVTINCTAEASEYVRVTSVLDNEEITKDYKTTFIPQEEKSGVITAELVKSYTDEDTSISVTCTIVASAVERDNVIDRIYEDGYKEELLNGTDPVLGPEMIPVKIADDGTVKYADLRTKWYAYGSKVWANAVLLVDNPSKTYEVNDIIDMDDIESFFVWVPKYKYKLFNIDNYTASKEEDSNKPVSIQIEFTLDETTDTDESCVSPKVAGKTDNCAVGKWMTHPAFINFDVNGLWIGKYEMGYKSGVPTWEISDSSAPEEIVIKPNVYAWKAISVRNLFFNSLKYKETLTSHMIKNTEWGAAAYLSHSKYGINTEVRANNNSEDTYYNKTGMSWKENTSYYDHIALPYNTTTGYKASTTGNISGIYDMSGGAYEYTAAYTAIGDSGLTTSELEKYARYFDIYPSNSTRYSYGDRILGDATGEVGPFYYAKGWYGDTGTWPYSNWTWHTRGSDSGLGTSGQFTFRCHTGGATSGYSSRVVLAVK